MALKQRTCSRADSAVIDKNSKRFGDNQIIKSSRSGMIQLRHNDELVHTLEGEILSTLGKLKRKYIPISRKTDKIVIELHTCNATHRYEFVADDGVWVKTTDGDGLF